jgi:hypothetical protein
MVDEPRRQPRSGSPALRIALIAAIIVMLGVWLYIGPLAPEPGLNLGEQPRATTATPRRFALWELHADDTVRVVELIARPEVKKGLYMVSGQPLRPGDEVLSVEWIGGELAYQDAFSNVCRGKTYLQTQYSLRVSSNPYGYDMRINHPPHLHINDGGRLISLGVDPKAYAQEIIAVAIPVDARLKRIYDYQPYQHLTLAGWDVFYYDTTDIQGHISIHIRYSPSNDAPSLDWTEVEANR